MKLTSRLILATLAALGSATVASAQDAPKQGGTFTYAVIQGDPDTFDCHATNSIASLLRLAPSYSLLLKYDADNYPGIVGDLAESWEISEDGLTYTFKIREGVKFHDGSAMTSEDVRASYERLRNPPEGVVSVRSANFLDIESIEAPDATTLVIKLKQPNASMIEILAGPFNCVYSAAKLKEDANWPATNVMGTGPFKFVKHDAGSEWISERNPDYFLPGKPYLDKLDILNMPLPAAINAMSAGQVSAIFPSMSQADVDRVAEARGDQVRVTPNVVTTVMFGVIFNKSKPPFDDVRVRQALNLAIDRRAGSEALSKIISASGFGTFLRPGSPFANSDEEIAMLPGYGTDIEASRAKARELLKEAGQENLKFTYLNWNRYAAQGVFLIDQWRQIGVEVDQEALEVAAYFGKQKAGDYTVSLDAIPEPSDDPTLRFAKLVSLSKNPGNLTQGDNPAFDALYEEQSRTLDPEKRIALTREMEKVLMEDAGMVPTFWSVRPYVLDANIGGLTYGDLANNYVGLDMASVHVLK